MEPRLPYSHLNLRRNPFGELDKAERQEIAITDSGELVEKLRVPGFAVQFIGDKGRGKTSNLLALRHYFPSAPYVHIGEGERPGIPHGTPLFIDEAQRLSRRMRRTVFRRKASFAIGTHDDLSPELRDAGLVFKTIHAGRILNAKRLAKIFQRRIERARRGPGPVPAIRRETIEALMDKYGDDARSMEDELYERFQLLGSVMDV